MLFISDTSHIFKKKKIPRWFGGSLGYELCGYGVKRMAQASEEVRRGIERSESERPNFLSC